MESYLGEGAMLGLEMGLRNGCLPNGPRHQASPVQLYGPTRAAYHLPHVCLFHRLKEQEVRKYEG